MSDSDSDSEAVQPQRTKVCSDTTTSGDLTDFDDETCDESELSTKRKWEDQVFDSDSSDLSEHLPGIDEELPTSEPPSEKGPAQATESKAKPLEPKLPASPKSNLPSEAKPRQHIEKLATEINPSHETEAESSIQQHQLSKQEIIAKGSESSQPKVSTPKEKIEKLSPKVVSKKNLPEDFKLSDDTNQEQQFEKVCPSKVEAKEVIELATDSMSTSSPQSVPSPATKCMASVMKHDKELQTDSDRAESVAQSSMILELENQIKSMDATQRTLQDEINRFKNPLYSFEAQAAATAAALAVVFSVEVCQQELDRTVEDYLLAAIAGGTSNPIPAPETPDVPFFIKMTSSLSQPVLPPEKYQPSEEERVTQNSNEKITEAIMIIKDIAAGSTSGNINQFDDILNQLLKAKQDFENDKETEESDDEQNNQIEKEATTTAAAILDAEDDEDVVTTLSLEEQLSRLILQQKALKESNEFEADLRATVLTQLQHNIHKLYNVQSDLEAENENLRATIAKAQLEPSREETPQQTTADFEREIADLKERNEHLQAANNFNASHAALEHDLYKEMVHKKTSAIHKTRKILRQSRLRENELMSTFDNMSPQTVFEYDYSSLWEVETRSRRETRDIEQLMFEELLLRASTEQHQFATIDNTTLSYRYKAEVLQDVRRVALLQSERSDLQKEIITLQGSVAETTSKLHCEQVKNEKLEEQIDLMTEQHKIATEQLARRSEEDFINLRTENEKLTTQLSLLQKDYERIRSENAELDTLRDQHEDIEGKALETEKQNKLLKGNLATIREKYDVVRGDLHAANSTIERLQTTLQTTDNQLSETSRALDQEREDAQQEILFLSDQLRKHTKKNFKNSESAEVAQRLKRKVSLLKSTIKSREIEVTSQISSLQDQHNREISDKTDDITKKCRSLIQENTDLQKIVKTLTIANKELQTGVSQHQTESKQLSAQVTGLYKDLDTYKTLLSTERALNDSSEADYLRLLKDHSQLKEEASALETEKSRLSSLLTDQKKTCLGLEEQIDNLNFVIRETAEQKESMEEVVSGYKDLVSKSNNILQKQVSERDSYPLQLKQELHSSKASNKRLLEENDLLHNTIEKLKKELLQEEICNKNLTSHNQALESVTRGARHRELIDNHQNNHYAKESSRQQLQIKQLTSTKDALEQMVDDYKNLLHSEKDIRREEVISLTDTLAETRAEVVHLQRTAPFRTALQQLPALETQRRTELKLHEKAALCGIVHFAMQGITLLNINSSKLLRTPPSLHLGVDNPDDGMPTLGELAARLDICMKSYLKNKKKKRSQNQHEEARSSSRSRGKGRTAF
eukprot:TRINITY_DN6016_c0_g2_i2.p1 TRINITY_DN6016_c0_g2~~TRINITY_DN6016_c0_g2_i2.p1  ORF type:complete len:1322 (+),score=329.91 TRINITY_DN6016_c0_g2_i2:72-4037(+)